VIPRTLIGAGIGAATGAGLGAATGQSAQPGQPNSGTRASRALKGAVAGGVLGGGIHAGLRYRKLQHVMPTGHNAEARDLALQALRQAKHPNPAQGEKLIRNVTAVKERLGHAAFGSQSPSGVVKNLQKENPLQGLNPAQAKKVFREKALQHHPDRAGGNAAAFQKIKAQHGEHQALFGKAPRIPKKASVALDSLQWVSFFDEIQKLANLKSPAAARSIAASVKGSTPKAVTGPDNPGIMPIGQTGVTATTSPMPQRALT